MNLKMKKKLSARTLNVGIGRIIILREDEIKDAITKQDIRDLVASGAIKIRETKGKRTKIRRSQRRGPGKVKKMVNSRKKDYMHLTRKLREYARQLVFQGKISRGHHKIIRKQIKSKIFRSKSHFKELMGDNKNKTYKNNIK